VTKQSLISFREQVKCEELRPLSETEDD
jgi:hypothetical protein